MSMLAYMGQERYSLTNYMKKTLWEMQCQKARIWNRRHFALWLSRQPKKMELDTYLSPKHNRDICLVSSYIALASKSDCDGEFRPL